MEKIIAKVVVKLMIKPEKELPIRTLIPLWSISIFVPLAALIALIYFVGYVANAMRTWFF